MNNHVIEVVAFKLNNGASEGDFLKTIPATAQFLDRMDGFIARRLSCDNEGNWLEHVEWESLAKAEMASKAFMKEESAMPMMQFIDKDSVKLSHNRLLVSAQ